GGWCRQTSRSCRFRSARFRARCRPFRSRHNRRQERQIQKSRGQGINCGEWRYSSSNLPENRMGGCESNMDRRAAHSFGPAFLNYTFLPRGPKNISEIPAIPETIPPTMYHWVLSVKWPVKVLLSW